MKKKTLELRTAIVIATITILSIGSIVGLVKLFDKISNNQQADFWFDVSLSFITSFFSAGIAYVVALIQIKSAQKIEDNKREIQNKKDINLILIEMEDNLEVLKIFIDHLQQINKQNKEVQNKAIYNQFSTDMWDRLINKIDISNGLMAKLLNIVKKKELIFCDELSEVKEVIVYKDEYESIYFLLKEAL